MVESKLMSQHIPTALQKASMAFGDAFKMHLEANMDFNISNVDVTPISGNGKRAGVQAAHMDEGGPDVYNYIIALEDGCRVEFYDASEDTKRHVVLRREEYVKFQKVIHFGINISVPRLHVKV